MFITLEGIEGCGKSTQLDMLCDYFKNKSRLLVCTREPGGTRIGREIRSILMNTDHTELEPLAELLLIAADRAQHVREVIAPALLAGEMVLCDRFMDSTVAYQGFGRGVDLKLVEQLNMRTVDTCVPDMTILIDCPVDVALKRTKTRLQRNRELAAEQRFEREDRSFHRRVREGFLWIAGREPERVIVLDGTLSPEELYQQVLKVVLDGVKRFTGQARG